MLEMNKNFFRKDSCGCMNGFVYCKLEPMDAKGETISSSRSSLPVRGSIHGYISWITRQLDPGNNKHSLFGKDNFNVKKRMEELIAH